MRKRERERSWFSGCAIFLSSNRGLECPDLSTEEGSQLPVAWGLKGKRLDQSIPVKYIALYDSSIWVPLVCMRVLSTQLTLNYPGLHYYSMFIFLEMCKHWIEIYTDAKISGPGYPKTVNI